MKKILNPTTFIIIALLAAAGWGIYLYAFSNGKETYAFKSGDLMKRDVVFSIDSTGTLEPEDIVDVGARVSGEIVAFGTDLAGNTVDYASRVKKDEIIALIDDEIPQSDLKEANARLEASKASRVKAQASLLVAEAALKQAQRDWQRAEKLGVSDALSQASYDSYLSSYEQANAQVESAKAQIVQADAEIVQAKASVSTAERNLGYCVIKSPVDGVVIDRKVNIGQTVVSNMNASSLFLIAKDFKVMEIWASVNEADIGYIKPGQKVTFTVDAFPNQTFEGNVGKVRLNASMSQNVVTYIVEVMIDNSDLKLLPYLTANLKFEIARKDKAWSVPISALDFRPLEHMLPPGLEIPKGKKIWLLDNAGNIKPVAVKTGLSDGIMYVEVIADGLAEGKVVTGVEIVSAKSSSGTTNPFTPTPPRRRGNSQQNQQQPRR